MKLLLLTDTHSGEDVNYPKIQGENYINVFGGALEENLEGLQKIAQEGDAIISLGDLIADTKDEERDRLQYQKALGMLRSLDRPLLVVAGNHDTDQAMSREAVAQILGQERLYYTREIGGYTHIILDGNRDGRVNGEIIWGQKYRFDKEQIAWLEKTLDESRNPCLVYGHFPIDDQDISDNPYWPTGDTTRVFPQGYREVRSILEKSGKVLAYCSGHTHFTHIASIGGILHLNLGSFSENDGSGKPTREYALVDLQEKEVRVKIRRLNAL